LIAILSFSNTLDAKKWRRHFKKHQTFLANNGHSLNTFNLFNYPGDENLYQSLINKEVETNKLLNGLDKEFEDEQKQIIAMEEGDRAKGKGKKKKQRPNGFVYKPNAKPWPINGNLPVPAGLQLINNAGGLPFCREFYKIDMSQPAELDAFCKWHLAPNALCSQLDGKCDELKNLMARRRSACTKSLLEIYNPRRKWKLKPHHKARKKYCSKIVKLRNPYTWCTKKCSKNPRGDACRRKKNQCTCKLNRWLANNRSLVSGDRSEAMCQPLPGGLTEAPDGNHPLNSILRCNHRVCDYIVGSELPWCDADRAGTFADSNYVHGNQQFASWTSGSGSCNMCECPNGIPSVAEQCPENGDVHCASCSGYFEMNEAMACVPMPTCLCPNGTPTPREECPNDGELHCSECDEGSTMSDDKECLLPEHGCYRDCASGRDLPHSFSIPANRPEGSIQYCRELCGTNGFAYAGVQFTSHCFCGNSYGSQGTANNCDMACNDGTEDICGGSCANNVYDSL